MLTTKLIALNFFGKIIVQLHCICSLIGRVGLFLATQLDIILMPSVRKHFECFKKINIIFKYVTRHYEVSEKCFQHVKNIFHLPKLIPNSPGKTLKKMQGIDVIDQVHH